MPPLQPQMTTDEVLLEMGSRLRRHRLNQNRTIAAVAADAGVATRTLERLETGRHSTLATLVKVLHALGQIQAIDAFLPIPNVSPIQMAKLAGRVRRRAGTSRQRTNRQDSSGPAES